MITLQSFRVNRLSRAPVIFWNYGGGTRAAFLR
jgi:hypothetical protein